MAEIVLELSQWAIPLFLILAPLYALFKGVDVYNVFCEGAAKGFALLVQILPFLLVFSVSGAMQLVLGWLEPWANRLGLPPDILPLAVLRSLSGSGALALCSQILETHGPDSFVGRLATTM